VTNARGIIGLSGRPRAEGAVCRYMNPRRFVRRPICARPLITYARKNARHRARPSQNVEADRSLTRLMGRDPKKRDPLLFHWTRMAAFIPRCGIRVVKTLSRKSRNLRRGPRPGAMSHGSGRHAVHCASWGIPRRQLAPPRPVLQFRYTFPWRLGWGRPAVHLQPDSHSGSKKKRSR